MGGAPLQRLSHDVRTPLNAILGHAELLLAGAAGPLSADARASLDDMQTAGRDALHHCRLLLHIVEALDADGSQPPEVFGVEDLFAGAWREVCAGAPIRACERVRALALEGDVAWWTTLARLIAEAARPEGPPALRIELDTGPTLALMWQGLDAAKLPATLLVLIDAVLRRHDGCLVWPSHGRLLLALPDHRLRRLRGGR